MKNSKTKNPVSKNMETFNRPVTHRDKKNDYQRPTGALKLLLEDLDKLKDRPVTNTGCQGYYDEWAGDYDCGYNTAITCEDCKYGSCGGRKDPAAKCNQL